MAKGKAPPPAIPASLAAPTLGWNARDALADMKPLYAVTLKNWFPSATDVVLRNGYTDYMTGFVQVETLMAYSGAAASKLFAIAGTVIYNATSGGASGNYLNIANAVTNYASTPDSANLDITGDIDIRAYVAADDWVIPGLGGAIPILWKWLVAGSQCSYRIYVFNGSLVLAWSETGNGSLGTFKIATSTGIIPANDGEAIWLRATLDVNNGAGGYTATFYYSFDASDTISVTWTQLGSAVIGASTTSIFSGSAELELGVESSTAIRIYRALVYSNISGTLKASFNAEDAAIGATSITSSATGEVYTCHGTAVIAGNVEVTGLTNARWQYVNFATPAGAFLSLVNGIDAPLNYDGTVWTNPSITGVTATNFIDVTVWKNRQWFVEKNTLKAWYLPVQSIAGVAAPVDMSAYCEFGGYIMACGTWTIDAGYGMDDMLVFITNRGEVIVWRGTDPTSATTFSLVGVFQVGAPIGRRCFVKYAGDCLIITQDGVVPLAAALQSSRLDPRISLTDIIQPAMSSAIGSYGGNFGWQIIQGPKQNLLILNVPVNEGADQEQYVMNTITKAWCQFTGWGANCWVLFNDDLYFGGNGIVGKAWTGMSDAGADIQSEALQAFNYFKSPGILKQWTMMRPTFNSTANPSIFANVSVDFDTTNVSSALSFPAQQYSAWDIATWDSGVWGGGLNINRQWQGCNGIGYCAAPHIYVSANGIEVHWVSTDLVMRAGGIL